MTTKINGLISFYSWLTLKSDLLTDTKTRDLTQLKYDRIKYRKKLRRSKDIVKNCCNLNVEQIIKMIDDNQKNINLIIHTPVATKTKSSITIAINMLMELNTSINKLELELKNEKLRKYDYSITSDIIQAYYERRAELMYTQGIPLSLRGLGNLQIVLANPIQITDWKSSFELKDKLVKEGIVPFSGKTEEGKKGEFWLLRKYVEGGFLKFFYTIKANNVVYMKFVPYKRTASRVRHILDNEKHLHKYFKQYEFNKKLNVQS